MNLCFFENNELIALFPYDVDLIAKVKELPQPCRRYDGNKKAWAISLIRYGKVNEETLDKVEAFLKENGFKVQASAKSWLLELRQRISAQRHEEERSLEESVAGDSEVEVEGLGGELRPFQRAGVSYMGSRRRVLLGDEMGLGKTVQAIATICHTNAFPCLVVCPVSLQLNWIREIEKWAVGKRVSGEAEESADFLVIPYSQIVKHENLLKKGTRWASMVCDESHYLKNSKAQRTKAVKSISKDIPDIYLLSGTPIVNRPAEFISQLQILRRLNELGGWRHFTERYCDAKQERFGLNISGASNLTELNSRLRKMCYIRRFKKDVLKELPSKQRSVIPVNIANRKAYEMAHKSVRKELEKLRASCKAFTNDVMATVMSATAEEIKKEWADKFPDENIPKHENRARLKRELNARLVRREVMVENCEAILLLNRLKTLAMQGHLGAAFEWIEDFLDSGEKLVIFCDHIEAQQRVYEKFATRSTAIMASMDAERRQRSVDKFQNDKNVRAIICSLGAGGVGFTMTASSNVLFIEQGWTPAVHDQAEDRTHRIGQEDAVMAYYMLGKDTIDEDIYELIEKKRRIVSAASDGDAGGTDSMVSDLLARFV